MRLDPTITNQYHCEIGGVNIMEISIARRTLVPIARGFRKSALRCWSVLGSNWTVAVGFNDLDMDIHQSQWPPPKVVAWIIAPRRCDGTDPVKQSVLRRIRIFHLYHATTSFLTPSSSQDNCIDQYSPDHICWLLVVLNTLAQYVNDKD